MSEKSQQAYADEHEAKSGPDPYDETLARIREQRASLAAELTESAAEIETVESKIQAECANYGLPTDLTEYSIELLPPSQTRDGIAQDHIHDIPGLRKAVREKLLQKERRSRGRNPKEIFLV